MDMSAYEDRVCNRGDRVMEYGEKNYLGTEDGVSPFPARPAESTIRPRHVKARNGTGLDMPAGESNSSGYASREWCGMVV